MKRRLNWLLAIVVILTLALTACGGDSISVAELEPIVEEAAEAVEEAAEPETVEEPAAEELPAQEPAAEESQEMEAAEPAPAPELSETELDEAFNSFLAGMERYNTISLEGLNEQLVEDPPPFLLDVRQPEELEEKGHIEGAVNIPLRELGQHLDLLPSFDTPVVSYCGSGWRCTIAMTGLGALGYEDILSLKGGSFGGWVETGYPVVEGPAVEPMMLDVIEPDPAMAQRLDETFSAIPEGWGVITAEALNTELAENPDLVVIDVRRQEEVEEKGVIEAANWIHIPLEAFVADKDQWPAQDAKTAVYCGSGHRSTMAMTILWAYGYEDVRSLKGGFGGWAEAGYPVVALEAAPSP